MTAANTPQLIESLRGIVGANGLLLDGADVEAASIDWRKMFFNRALCVVRPGSGAEVAAVVRICGAAGVRLVPQGGNTGLAGGAVPDPSGSQVIMSLSRMTRIREIDPIGMTIETEAGCVLQAAQEAALSAGRLLPISLAAEGSATIGGVVAANAGGINVLRYGMARALVLGLEVVLPDGSIAQGLRRLRKDNAGYDWKQLFIGSEGTLGIVTAAVLRLVPKPRHVVTALLSVPDPDAALSLLALCQDELGDQLSAFELVSGTSIGLVEKHAHLACPIRGGSWFVLMEAASSLSGLREAAEGMLVAALERQIALDGVVAETGAQAKQLWALRERITESEASEGRSVKHDVSLPISLIPRFLEEAGRILAVQGRRRLVNAFGHLGDGNIHYNLVVEDCDDAAAINKMVHDLVASMGGSISAEHGIGQYRLDELARYRSPVEMELSRIVKHAIDPTGVMNPGKVLRT